MMYRIANLVAPQKIKIEKREDPTLNSEEAIIEVSTAGICGTDLAIFSGNYEVPLPIVLGHEFSGRIKAVGNEKHENLIGKRATAEINNTCKAYNREKLCSYCSAGLISHCSERNVFGIIEHDGAFAEQVKVPINNIHLLPDSISDEAGVFIEPFAAAMQTFKISKIIENDLVVVLGAGRLGILIVKAAKYLGARVLAVSNSKTKLARAKVHGADHVMQSSEPILSKIKDLSNNLGADMVVECTGNSNMINEALKLVRCRGVIALKSTSGVPANSIDITDIVVREIQLSGSRCGNFTEAIDIIKNEKFNLESLISKKYSLEDTEKALIDAPKESKVIIKI